VKKTLKDMDFKGKKTLVRVDFNVPLEDGQVKDATRIQAALPTIKFLLDEEARIILMSHLGRPKGQVDESLRLDPVAEKLADELQKEVVKVDDCIGEEPQKAIEQMENGNLVLLENTRFYAGEKANDADFSCQLAELADIYVNDAFGAAHRAHASTVGVTDYLPSVAGFLLQREINALGKTLENPGHPFVSIIGGAKVSDKMGVIKNLIKKVDYILTGGGIANTFLAAQGYNMQKSLFEEDILNEAKELIEEAEKNNVELVLPDDLVIASEFSDDAERDVVKIDNITEGWQALDSGGPETLAKYKEILQKAKTITWNGPIGVFEFNKFAGGTIELAKIIAESNARSIIGGGESAAAIKKAGVENKMTHISTGGGASLMFMEGKPLPGIEALDDLN